MDLDEVATACAQLRDGLEGVALHYAVKCNPDQQVLDVLHGLGCRFEIASWEELRLLVGLGVDPADVLYSNPVKPAAHVSRCAEAGVWRFAVDSRAELEKVARLAPGASVYVRMRAVGSSGAVASEGKFGVDPADAVELLSSASSIGLRAYGLAFHVGSQTLQPRAWEQAIARAGEVMRELAGRGVRLEMLDVGGGFPAAYDTPVPPPAAFGRVIRAACRRHLPYPVLVVAEPGRALVATAGTMVATVVGVARRPGATWVHLDVGALNGFIEALETGMRLRYPTADSRGGPQQRYCVTGPTCDSQDTVLREAPLSAGLREGDRVFLGSAGAYTACCASRFNGFDIPTVRHVARRAPGIPAARSDAGSVQAPRPA
nr:type III PLP-dependent enzyme [Motilibacter deserti]